MWDLWRQDPVTAQWSPGDLALILDLGEHFYAIKQADRLRTLTVLGLNAAGRRNLRLRIPVESQRYEEAERQAAEVRRLRIVDNRRGELTDGPHDHRVRAGDRQLPARRARAVRGPGLPAAPELPGGHLDPLAHQVALANPKHVDALARNNKTASFAAITIQ
jgi:hypothetical protein